MNENEFDCDFQESLDEILKNEFENESKKEKVFAVNPIMANKVISILNFIKRQNWMSKPKMNSLSDPITPHITIVVTVSGFDWVKNEIEILNKTLSSIDEFSITPSDEPEKISIYFTVKNFYIKR